MRYASVCSGIEAPTVAWHPLGWRPVFFSEIDAFPCAVLAHHYPDAPNYGDMTKFKDWPDAAIDVLVGGTPCQSFSVAGLRKGLDDPRGNLMLTFGAIAAKYRPQWLVWENVPGVLSSNAGRDFGTFLGMLAELGYGFAYRVLDAQFFGLAQRRKRVFVVGCLGDWRRAAAVLFERASLSGNPSPRREAGKETTAGTLRSTRGGCDVDHARAAHLCPEVSPALKARDCKGPSSDGDGDGAPLIAHALRADGFDGSEDGTGRGTPLGPVAYSIGSHAGAADADVSNRSHANGGPSGMGIQVEVAHSLRAGRTQAVAHAFDARQSDVIQYGDKAGPLDTDGYSMGVLAFDTYNQAVTGDTAQTLCSRGDSPGGNAHLVSVVAFHENQRAEVALNDTAGSLKRAGGKPGQGYPAAMVAMQVRRLTPRECERLQGFPDDYTLIPYRGKPAADGPRYKALGNSMAVPVVRWIGQRIARVDELTKKGH